VPKERLGEALLHLRDILAGADGDEFSARRTATATPRTEATARTGHDEQHEEELAAWAHLLDAGLRQRCSYVNSGSFLSVV
jgi:hypothetical protein